MSTALLKQTCASFTAAIAEFEKTAAQRDCDERVRAACIATACATGGVLPYWAAARAARERTGGYRLSHSIKRLARESHAQDGLLITALIVLDGTTLPSSGFDKQYKELTGTQIPQESEQRAKWFEAYQSIVRTYYSRINIEELK
jgi:hypothetical protein